MTIASSSYSLAQCVGLVAQHVRPGIIVSDFPDLTHEQVLAEAERQLGRLEADLVDVEDWREAPEVDGYANKVRRLEEKRHDILAYLGRPQTVAQAQAHRADVTLRVRCLTVPLPQLAGLVELPDRRHQEVRRRLEGLKPDGLDFHHVKSYLTETVARYELALKRAPEIHAAIVKSLGDVWKPLREHLLACHPDVDRYVAIRRELADLVVKNEFIGGTGSTASAAESLRSRADGLKGRAQAEVDARLADHRNRIGRGELAGLATVLEIVATNPDRFPVSARELRLAAYRAAAAVDPLPFALLDLEWPVTNPGTVDNWRPLPFAPPETGSAASSKPATADRLRGVGAGRP